jgi:hypothetical protein
MRKLFSLITTILLAACNIPFSTPRSVAGAASDTPANKPCSLNWATQSLPDLSTRVQSAMETARLPNVRIIAEAYGENCLDAQTNQAVSFTTMETDYRVTAQVQDLTAREQMGNLLESILIVIDGFPTGTTPGSLPGYIGVTFQAGDDEVHLWFPRTNGVSARTQGLHGAALLEKLQK